MLLLPACLWNNKSGVCRRCRCPHTHPYSTQLNVNLRTQVKHLIASKLLENFAQSVQKNKLKRSGSSLGLCLRRAWQMEACSRPVVLSSMHSSVRSLLNYIVNTIFWKWMNRSWGQKRSTGQGHETINFGVQEVKGQGHTRPKIHSLLGRASFLRVLLFKLLQIASFCASIF